jgi:hypothetical protein
VSALHLRALGALVFAGVASTAAADYTIDWYAIHGGGGTSQAGAMRLDGTIGQPAPGYSDGANYQLTSGFWVAAPLVSDVIFRNGFEGETP